MSNISVKLLRKNAQFNSLHIDGLKMVQTKYSFPQTRTPYIVSNKIVNNGIKEIEYSEKRFSNGNIFEVYNLPGEIIKVIKNKFGEIKALKSSTKSHNSINQERLYQGVKDIMEYKIKNFLS